MLHRGLRGKQQHVLGGSEEATPQYQEPRSPQPRVVASAASLSDRLLNFRPLVALLVYPVACYADLRRGDVAIGLDRSSFMRELPWACLRKLHWVP